MNRVFSQPEGKEFTEEEIASITKLTEQYHSMGDTMKLYDDLVAAGASEETLKQFDDDLKAGRFALSKGYEDPVNEYRRAYGLPAVEK